MVGGNWITGRQKTRNHGYDVIVGGELFTDYSDHLANLSAKPKTQINRRRTLPASSCWVDVYRKEAWPERLLPKSQDAVALQQIKERGALPMTIAISVRQSTVAAISPSLPGAGYGQFEHKADSLIAKFKEAGGTVREIDV